MMETRCISRYQRISPRKCRRVADQVRSLPVGEALELLRFSPHKAAQLLRKTVESALANAENNHGADIDLLRVVNLATGSENPGVLYESYSEWAAREDLPPVDLASFIGVVALLIADGVLVPGPGR